MALMRQAQKVLCDSGGAGAEIDTVTLNRVTSRSELFLLLDRSTWDNRPCPRILFNFAFVQPIVFYEPLLAMFRDAASPARRFMEIKTALSHYNGTATERCTATMEAVVSGRRNSQRLFAIRLDYIKILSA